MQVADAISRESRGLFCLAEQVVGDGFFIPGSDTPKSLGNSFLEGCIRWCQGPDYWQWPD
ncbi:MAG: hypothetical protein Tsb002_38820 [Wenzhouxiangellaceae bacterium]